MLASWSRGFIVKEYALSSNKIPPLMDGMKIVQLSDIHYGLQIDNNVNIYSTTIASSRLNLWSYRIVEYCPN